MGAFQTIERRIWQAATGSPHPNYRQALWRPTSPGPMDTLGPVPWDEAMAPGSNFSKMNFS